MSKRVFSGICVTWMFCAAIWAAQPEIVSPLPTDTFSVRLMDTTRLQVSVNNPDSRPLVYNWEIVNNPTGQMTLSNTIHASTKLQAYWESEATAQNYVGQQALVRATVSFGDAGPDDLASSVDFNVTISGVNRAPVPVIDGNLGTREEPIRSGGGVTVNSFQTWDPDGGADQGEFWISHWGLGSKRGTGRYITGIALLGTEGAIASFNVPDMTGPVEQDIILLVGQGLHAVETTATAYLAPDDGSSGGGGSGDTNLAPTLSLSQSSYSVTQGGSISLVANASDTNGDDLAFSWVFVGGAGTVSQSQVSTIRTSTTGWRSTYVFNSNSFNPGTYQLTVRARETGTTDLFASTSQTVTVQVLSGGGGGGTGVYDETIGSCSGNTGPRVVSIVPDPRQSAVQFLAGQPASIEIIFSDSSQESSPLGGTRTGVPSIVWDLSALNQLGIQASNSIRGTGIETQAKSTLSFTAADTVDASPTVTVTASDVLGCQSTVTLGFTITPQDGGGGTDNQPPDAKIRYDEGSGLNGPFSDGAGFQPASRSITLDAAASADDEGLGNLSFTWSATGITGASLSSSSGTQTTLTVPASAQGSVTVTLRATDSDTAFDESTIVFSYSAATEPPVATIVSAPESVQSGHEFEVLGEGTSGSESGSGQFSYQWSASASNNESVGLFVGGERAKIVAPAASGSEPVTVTVSLVVVEDGVASESTSTTVSVTEPELFFSQLAVGPLTGTSRFETSVVLINRSSDELAEGTLVFQNNEDGEDWSLLVDGEELSQMDFSIAPGGARRFRLTGVAGDQVESGWLRLTSDVPLTGHLFYRVVDSTTGEVISEVPILPVIGRNFRTALGPGANDDLALALVNLSDQAQSFRLIATTDDGRALETGDISIGPMEHTAQFLGELFANHAIVAIPDTFQGGTLTLKLTEGSGELVATVIKTKDGLPLSILPVVVE